MLAESCDVCAVRAPGGYFAARACGTKETGCSPTVPSGVSGSSWGFPGNLGLESAMVVRCVWIRYARVNSEMCHRCMYLARTGALLRSRELYVGIRKRMKILMR